LEQMRHTPIVPLSTPRCTMPFMFEKLDVYQEAVDVTNEVASLTENFPRGFGFLVDQLNRAALSIATNLAERNGRFTKPDRRNFFTIAPGSAQECVPLLEIARRRGLVKEPDSVVLKEQLDVIARMISGLINGLHERDG
jgi:four helix bundle protein